MEEWKVRLNSPACLFFLVSSTQLILHSASRQSSNQEWRTRRTRRRTRRKGAVQSKWLPHCWCLQFDFTNLTCSNSGNHFLFCRIGDLLNLSYFQHVLFIITNVFILYYSWIVFHFLIYLLRISPGMFLLLVQPCEGLYRFGLLISFPLSNETNQHKDDENLYKLTSW